MAVINAVLSKLSIDGTNALSSIRTIQIGYTAQNPQGVSSSGDTTSAQFGAPGVTDWNANATFYGKTLPALPGAAVSFVAHNGSEQTTGTGIVERVEVHCDIEGGGLIGGSLVIAANSALTFSATATALTDTSIPNIFSTGGSAGCKAQWSLPVLSFADIADVRSWSFTVARVLAPFVSSGTAGVTKRTAGALAGVSATVSCYQGTPSVFATAGMLPGAMGALRLFVDSTTFFDLKYVSCGEVSPDINIEGSANLSHSMNFAWSAYTPVSGTPTRGLLHKPGAVAIWP